MNQKQLYKLKSKSTNITPTVQIGKRKITESIITEINNQFKHTEMLKIKFLPSFKEEKREAAEKLAQLTTSEIVDLRGNTTVLYRRKR
jgi:RNA-binding protein